MAQEPIRVVALRHIMCEYLGAFERLFEDAGAEITYVDVPAGGELPRSHDSYDLLTILGGPMSVNDPDSWLIAEKRFVREAIERGKPVLGLCLGAQMIASQPRRQVAPGKRKEVGFMEIDVGDAAASDPLLRHFARPRQMVFSSTARASSCRRERRGWPRARSTQSGFSDRLAMLGISVSRRDRSRDAARMDSRVLGRSRDARRPTAMRV